ncbi:MAG: alpha/beta fold hydrolase [Pirellulales bacterium]
MNTWRRLIGGGLLVVSIVLIAGRAISDPPAPAAAPTKSTPPADDWARRHLTVDDPLAARQTLTLADLDQALVDPKLRRTVVRHVARAALEESQAIDFLTRALTCDTLSVRREAAVELQRRGKIVEVVRQLLWEMARSDNQALRDAVILSLETNGASFDQVPDEYWDILIDSLGRDDPRVQTAAARQLELGGVGSIPSLLDALRSDDPRVQRAAAEVLARVLALATPDETPTAPEAARKKQPAPPAPADQPAAPPPKFVPPRPIGSPVRSLEPQPPTPVTVYFATNRAWMGERSPWLKLTLGTLGGGLGIALAFGKFERPTSTTHPRQNRLLRVGMLACGLVVGGWSLLAANDAVRELRAPLAASPFATERDALDRIHYGFCVVTIPPSHVEGNLEEPLLGLERDSEHVKLQQTELRDEQAFFDEVRNAVHRNAPARQDCLVFVHGYNVTFENAARRTAQIHFDLKFPGVPLFFSWPSRGNPAEYSWDRQEVEQRSYRDIQRFLVDVARRTGAPRVHVLAHSMGAEAVTKAIRELGEEGQIFDQVILAAPDINRKVFHDEIAPRLIRNARRTTLYCSKNDRALFLSRYWNSWGDPAPRAGDSTDGPLLAVGTDTIDASTIRTDLLGHSYYGDCVPLLHDVGLLLREGLSPDQRKLEPQVVDDAAPNEPRWYWMLREPNTGDTEPKD